ncbi:MAG: NAD-dependent epimerase/dehydratase family protein [Acidimicrobiales bacterium]
MKVAVTGGLGLLGRAVVDCLIDRGHTPVIVDRAVDRAVERAVEAGAAAQLTADVAHVQADIRYPDQITAAFSGVDAVIHTASLIDLHLGQPASLHDVNVAGASNVVSACRHNRISKLVHMSSAEVISGTTPLRGITETESSYPEQQLTHYGLTKRGGEEAVLAAADEHLGTCAMRTYGMFGVGDNTVLPLYLKTLPGKSIMHMGDLKAESDLIFAPNLAFCLVLAVERLQPDVDWSGTVFHVTDHEPVNVQRFLGQLVEPLGYNVVERFKIPRSVASTIARFYETRYRVTGLERFARPPLTDHKLRLALDDYWLDSSRVRKVLSYEPPFSRAESIAATQEWLLATGGRRGNEPGDGTVV